MTSHHPSEPDSATADSVNSTPRSDQQQQSYPPFPLNHHEPRVRFMCSFGGRILPRPHDNQLRYVGGDTRMVAVHRSTSFSGLQSKLSKLSTTPDITLKYQLPNEELDALISVTTDEDVENMIEEYDRLAQHSTKTPRLRLFLFPSQPTETGSVNGSIGSLLGGSAKRESWFLDALNGGLERGRSEVSSIVSEVPDYLFGFDNSDESKHKTTRPVLSENVSDPGSPAPPVSSPYGFSSSPIPDLPPVKTNVETQTVTAEIRETQMRGDPVQIIPQTGGFAANPVWHYVPETHMHGPGMQPMPVYYLPAGNVPVRTVMHAPYSHRPGVVGQIPVGYPQPVSAQVYGRGGEMVRSVGVMEGYEFPIQDGVVGQQQQQVYYAAARNVGAAYPTAGIAGEMQGGGSTEMKIGRVSQSQSH